MIEDKKARPARWPQGRQPASTWWLLTKEQNSCTEVPLVDCGDEQGLLPVFSGEGEAKMFVRFVGTCGDNWRVREISAGELVSALYDLRARVRSIALDPCPEMLATESIGLVSLDRRRFVRWLADWSSHLLSEESAHRSGKA